MKAFDVDGLVADCRAALDESQAQLAVRDVLERALADRSAVADVLASDTAGITPLYKSDEITVVNVLWAPGMSLYPHDHRMWANVGAYTGTETNFFYRRSNGRIERSGEKAVDEGAILLMGDDVIHSVTNTTGRFTGAIHVYGGDFFGGKRSEWDPDTLDGEQPYDMEHTARVFDEANAAYRADHH